MGQGVLESTTIENPSFFTRVASWLSKPKTSFLEVVSCITNYSTPAAPKNEVDVPKLVNDESQEPDLEASLANSSTSPPISISISSSKSESKTLSCGCQNNPKKLSNPIAQSLREVELGKAFLTFIMPIAAIILAVPNKESFPKLVTSTLCLISCALVFLFYGNSLRIMSPKMASAFEQIGYSCIYTSFFMAVGSHIPPTLVWLPFICFLACVVLSLCSFLPFQKKNACPCCDKDMKP